MNFPTDAKTDRLKKNSNGTVTAPLALETPTHPFLMTAEEWEAKSPPPRYLIEGVVLAGQCGVICGPLKGFKTGLADDQICSVVTGTPFLGVHPVTEPGKVILVCNEGQPALFPRLRAIFRARGKSFDDFRSEIGFNGGTSEGQQFLLDNPRHVDDMCDAIRVWKPKLVVLDSAYKAMTGKDLHNRSAVVQNLKKLDVVAAETDAAIVLTWHANSPGHHGLLEPDNCSWAGIGEWARFWLLVNHRCKKMPDHQVSRLWCRYGHYGVDEAEAVDIVEGDGSEWKVNVMSYAEAKKPKVQSEQPPAESKDNLKEDLAAVVNAVAKLQPTSGGATQSAILREVGGRLETLKKTLAVALENVLLVKDGNRYEIGK